MRYQNSASSHF